ncbi:MAG: hypothetical protein ACNFW9_01430 [Candidatus Kerfeldbacteria bacterium]
MTESIVKNLEKSRRLAFDNFDNIILEPKAVEVLVNLFIHPGCKSDINLAKFLTGLPVPLKDISSHIITAFPSQVATYAKASNKTIITGVDLLECFALDHADAVEENYKALGFNPSYALAHILTIGRTSNLRSVEGRKLVDMEVMVCGNSIKFSNILAPLYLNVLDDQVAFHHFGVVVAVTDSKVSKIFARKLQTLQDNKNFLQKTVKQILGKEFKSIDYSKESFFKVDMTGKILDQSKQDMDFFKLWQDEDLRNIKIPKELKRDNDKVMFQS